MTAHLFCEQKSLFCLRCGREMEYFHSPENNTWFVAHHRLKHVREGKDFPFCVLAHKVWYAPKVELNEAN